MTSAPLDTTAYGRVFAIDTQVVFEARPLEQLNWHSLSKAPILLLVTPQVMSEVDAKKRDGRLGKRAREFNRLLQPCLESGIPTCLVETPIRVDLALVVSSHIDWKALDDLERENGDDRIVAQALYAMVDDATRIEVMSFDVRPRAAAGRHGLGAFRPDEAWLLDPEPSASDRRIAELERQIRVLSITQPELKITIASKFEGPLIHYRVPPLAIDVAQALTNAVAAKHPRDRSNNMFGLGNPTYDNDYAEYLKDLSERDIPNIHKGLERLFSQYAFEIKIENVGALTAEHLTVEIRSGNAVVHAAPFWVSVFGPSPPDAHRSIFLTHVPNIPDALRTDRAYFYLEESDPDGGLEYRCQDFRQGRRHVLTIALELTERTRANAQLEVRLTSSNMRGDLVERSMITVVQESHSVAELIDLDKQRLKVPPSVIDHLSAMPKESITCYRNDGAPEDE